MDILGAVREEIGGRMSGRNRGVLSPNGPLPLTQLLVLIACHLIGERETQMSKLSGGLARDFVSKRLPSMNCTKPFRQEPRRDQPSFDIIWSVFAPITASPVCL